MPQIRVLPHVEICPDGAVFDVADEVLDGLFDGL